MSSRNISIVWDFDGTLTPMCSTSKTVEILKGKGGSDKPFWDMVKSLRGEDKKPKLDHILASDAPIWMYSLSRLAFHRNTPLNREFFVKFVKPHIKLYPNVVTFLRKIKSLEEEPDFSQQGVEIHHFIVSAGLKDLVEECFPPGLITWTFGCRYEVTYQNEENRKRHESVPVFCMDETMKTRSIFEIVKGTFNDPKKPVNTRVEDEDLWSPFSDMIYVGDGPTDVPALSLVRDRGGIGVVVYNGASKPSDIKKRLNQMSIDRRADCIAPADYSLSGDLFRYLKSRCYFILKQYEAANIDSVI